VRRQDRGVALVLVLGAVVLLTLLAVELASTASVSWLRMTRTARDAAFRRLVDSASEVARGLIAEPEPVFVTHWGQKWNCEILFSLRPGEGASVRLEDESGKLNIAQAISHPAQSVAIAEAVVRLFSYLARHEGRGESFWRAVARRVLDRISYRDPLLTLDGLRETGLDSELLFGPNGVSRYLTCFGDGRINLNTAPRPVLASLDSDLDDEMIERIAHYRGKGEGESGSYKVFQTPEDLILVEGIVNRSVGADGQARTKRSLLEKVQGLVTVRSDCWGARIAATTEGRSRLAWAFFLPDGTRLTLEELLP